jgi:hypothetical protein
MVKHLLLKREIQERGIGKDNRTKSMIMETPIRKNLEGFLSKAIITLLLIGFQKFSQDR